MIRLSNTDSIAGMFGWMKKITCSTSPMKSKISPRKFSRVKSLIVKSASVIPSVPKNTNRSMCASAVSAIRIAK